MWYLYTIALAQVLVENNAMGLMIIKELAVLYSYPQTEG
jgi:hypothetical protein